MTNYRVVFFKKDVKEKEDKKLGLKETYEYKLLGSMHIDDNGTSNSFPLASKAFRASPENWQMADKVMFEKI